MTAGGVVLRPVIGDSSVILTATFVKGNATETKQFVITVKGQSSSYPSTPSSESSSTSSSTVVEIVVDVESGNGDTVSKTTIKRTKAVNGTENDDVTLTEKKCNRNDC